jgi:hypothetical protein
MNNHIKTFQYKDLIKIRVIDNGESLVNVHEYDLTIVKSQIFGNFKNFFYLY